MEMLVIEYNNLVELLKIAITAFGSISACYVYLKSKGVKFASLDKVLEYRNLQNLMNALGKYVSPTEAINIFAFAASELAKNGGKLPDESEKQLIKMIKEAVSTPETVKQETNQ